MEEYVVGGLGALAHKVVQTRAAEVLHLVPAMSHACMRAACCPLHAVGCKSVARSCMLYVVRSTLSVACGVWHVVGRTRHAGCSTVYDEILHAACPHCAAQRGSMYVVP